MVYLATDHAGFELKEKVKEFLIKEGYKVEDCGAYQYDKADDYPDFISRAAKSVSENPQNVAIIFGNSGQGEAMVANKFPNVRAAVYYGRREEMPKLTREHNDSNILSLGSGFLTETETFEAVKLFLDTAFSKEERHIRRIEKMRKIEENL